MTTAKHAAVRIPVAGGTTPPAHHARPAAAPGSDRGDRGPRALRGQPQHPRRRRRPGRGRLPRLGRQQALADVAAAIGWLRSQPGIERVAVIGFSAGAHLGYLAACRLPVSRTVGLYGGWLPTTDIPVSRPSPTLGLTSGISGRILYLVGEEGTLIEEGQRRQIREALRNAGVDHEVVTYPGAGHAFFWPGTPGFHEGACDDAWARILAMLAS